MTVRVPEGEPDHAGVSRAIGGVLGEVLDGASPASGWLLNRGDAGLLESIESLSATQASTALPDGASVAAHVEHLRYSLRLLNRRSQGEDPFGDADWTAAWKKKEISAVEWDLLRRELAGEARQWKQNFKRLVVMGEADLTEAVASAAHIAYHLGAIRQILPATRRTRGKSR